MPESAVGGRSAFQTVTPHQKILAKVLRQLARLGVAEEDRVTEPQRAPLGHLQRRLHLARALEREQLEPLGQRRPREPVAPRLARGDVASAVAGEQPGPRPPHHLEREVGRGLQAQLVVAVEEVAVEEPGADRHLGERRLARAPGEAAGAAAVEDRRPEDAGQLGAHPLDLAPRALLHHRARRGLPPGEGVHVGHPGDLRLVAHQPVELEVRKARHLLGERRHVIDAVERAAPHAHVEAERPPTEVDLEHHRHLGVRAGRRGLERLELLHRVGHHGEHGAALVRRCHLVQVALLERRVGEQHVARDPLPHQQLGLGGGIGHQPGGARAGVGEHPPHQLGAAHRLGRHAQLLAAQRAEHRAQVGLEGVEIDERGGQRLVAERPLEALPGAGLRHP